MERNSKLRYERTPSSFAELMSKGVNKKSSKKGEGSRSLPISTVAGGRTGRDPGLFSLLKDRRFLRIHTWRHNREKTHFKGKSFP